MNATLPCLLRRTTTLAAALAIACMAAAPAAAIEWNGVAEKQIVLFYPGQASWEWALTESDHSGAPKFREGKNCRGCHDGEQAEIGAKLVAAGPLEPAPIAGKPGSLPLAVQVAHDGERLYLRLRWTGHAPTGTQMDPEVATHATVMLSDASVKEAMRAGCWGSCHADAMGMAFDTPQTELTKYLVASRNKVTRQGGGQDVKPDADLAALLEQGAFLEYLQAKLNPGQPAQAVSGYILAGRERHPEPLARASASEDGRSWTLVLDRTLEAAGPGQKKLAAGNTYAIGFAIHDDHTEHRFHYVSLEYTLTLDGGDGDFVARRQ